MMGRVLVTAFLLGGCATAPPLDVAVEQAMPRFGTGLLGIERFYEAVCVPPPPAHEQDCREVHDVINEVVAAYGAVNQVLKGAQ